eukprot:TRINITY_DN10960_c0_g1_i2.p1 TRINITY_DN10960_c0_g1~~TRINITY_DN10960_c0_g1_i2.p1  ORF type:complete len:348 (+),score=90.20 TRINITY_DN10960_c0_g1_i2:45-1088(+)
MPAPAPAPPPAAPEAEAQTAEPPAISQEPDPWRAKPGTEVLQILEEGLSVARWRSGDALQPPSGGSFMLDASDQEQLAALPEAVPAASASRVMALRINSAILSAPDALLSGTVCASCWPFLRELQMQDTGIERFPDITALPELRCLDISFNPLRTQHVPDSAHDRLMSLSMDGCEIEELSGRVCSQLAGLVTLSLTDNLLQDLQALAAIRGCVALTTLNVAENDLCSDTLYPNKLSEWAPSLRRVDVHFLGSCGPGHVSLGDRTAYLSSTKNQSKGVMDAQADSSTCSCVEGNPCASNEHCFATVQQLVELGLAPANPGVEPSMRVSISHRKEEVASAARRKKGMAD